MSRLSKLLLAVCSAGLLAFHGSTLAQQVKLDAQDAVQTLTYKNNSRAKAELQTQAQAWQSSPFLEVRRGYLITLIGVAFDIPGTPAKVLHLRLLFL